jgi:hypothetical protein
MQDIDLLISKIVRIDPWPPPPVPNVSAETLGAALSHSANLRKTLGGESRPREHRGRRSWRINFHPTKDRVVSPVEDEATHDIPGAYPGDNVLPLFLGIVEGSLLCISYRFCFNFIPLPIFCSTIASYPRCSSLKYPHVFFF